MISHEQIISSHEKPYLPTCASIFTRRLLTLLKEEQELLQPPGNEFSSLLLLPMDRYNAVGSFKLCYYNCPQEKESFLFIRKNPFKALIPVSTELQLLLSVF